MFEPYRLDLPKGPNNTMPANVTSFTHMGHHYLLVRYIPYKIHFPINYDL